MHPIHHDICENLSYKIVGLVGVLPAAAVLAVIFTADFGGASLASVAGGFLPALVLAMALRFLVEWCLALAAFWLTRGHRHQRHVLRVVLLFRRSVRALSVLPGWMQTIAAWTPFPWSLAFPVEVSLGRRTGADIWLGYLIQSAWIAGALLALWLLWRRATRRYSAVGA